jgi:uncharacterized protein YndB with AHSA1/START domain
MSTIRCEITIDRPIEAVYDYFANPDRYVAQATPDIESVERVDAGPTVPGSTFRFHHSSGPVRESTSRFTVVRTNRELQFEGVVGFLRPWNQLVFEPVNGATSVRFVGRANPTGPVKLLGPFVSRVGRRLWAERLAKAKAFLEAHGTSDASGRA